MNRRAMKLSILALSVASLCAPGVALAQGDANQNQPRPTDTLLAQAQTQQYVVYFPLGEATLDAEAQATISAAAADYQRTGTARVTVRGYTDTSGSVDFNQTLSDTRAQAVADELIRQGVPPDAITRLALGETDLAVPTGDDVREGENRRVEIAVEQLPPPPEPVPAPAPEPEPPVAAAPPPPEPEPEAKRGLFSIGPFYGYNLEDETGNTSHFAGLNLSLDYAVLPFLGVGVEQAGFYHFDTGNDGFGGRSAGSLNFLAGTEQVAAHLGGNIGYLYGSGIDEDFFAGPEIGIVAGGFNAKVAYDIPFNRDLDEGIIAGTLGFGVRF